MAEPVTVILEHGLRAHYPEESHAECHCARDQEEKDALYLEWSSLQDQIMQATAASNYLLKLGGTIHQASITALTEHVEKLKGDAAELHCQAREWKTGDEVSDTAEIWFLRRHNVQMHAKGQKSLDELLGPPPVMTGTVHEAELKMSGMGSQVIGSGDVGQLQMGKEG